jgi:hypothetical protein
MHPCLQSLTWVSQAAAKRGGDGASVQPDACVGAHRRRCWRRLASGAVLSSALVANFIICFHVHVDTPACPLIKRLSVADWYVCITAE